MKRNQNLIIGIILTATVGFIAIQNRIAPQPDNETQTSPAALTVTNTEVNEVCAYMWAYHDAPELTEKLGIAVRALNPDAITTASLYGEDCVYSDGRSTFGVMETNFNVRIQVENLTDEETFGIWMEQVMQIIIQIPRSEIQGNYGHVEFWFETSGDHIIVRIPITKYIDEAQGKTGIELFQSFHIPP